jgi:uncharacterized membrane protein YbaN (DUF454 family)
LSRRAFLEFLCLALYTVDANSTFRLMAHRGPMSQAFKNTLIILGILCVALGVIGVFIPLLPTTPFLLAAAFCFNKASPSLLNWLFSTPFLGKYIADYKNGRGIPFRVKASTIGLLWVSIVSSALLVTGATWTRILLFLIACAVSIHIMRLPTKERE